MFTNDYSVANGKVFYGLGTRKFFATRPCRRHWG